MTTIFASLLAVATRATLLSDSFLGSGRAALQDALPGLGDDAFQSFANPAWVPEHSRIGLLETTGLAQMNHLAASEKPVNLLTFVLQERKDRLSYGFFATLPAGSQAILDTGDPFSKTSPWMNMNRQLLAAANVSESFAGGAYRVGLLVPVTFDAEATARSHLNTGDVQSRASVSLKPRLSWALGVSARPESTPGWTWSLFYKQPSVAHATAEIEGNVPLLALDLLFKGESTYSFDPRRVSFNAVHDGPVWSFGARARFSQWSTYALPFVTVTQSSLVIDTTPRMAQALNAWDLALGAERRLGGGQTLAGSVGWRQSPFKKIEAFRDSDEAIVGMGWGAEFSDLWSISTTLRCHVLTGGVLYTWAGLGLGYRL